MTLKIYMTMIITNNAFNCNITLFTLDTRYTEYYGTDDN